MTRISITLPTSLSQTLQQEARQRETSVSDLIRTVMSRHFFSAKILQRERSLAALQQMAEQALAGGERLSESVDEVLYGEHGAWRGQSDEE